MSTHKPGSPTFLQDFPTIQQNGSTNYCRGIGRLASRLKPQQLNAASAEASSICPGVLVGRILRMLHAPSPSLELKQTKFSPAATVTESAAYPHAPVRW